MRKRSTQLISANKRVNVDQEEFVSGRQEAASAMMAKSKRKSNDLPTLMDRGFTVTTSNSSTKKQRRSSFQPSLNAAMNNMQQTDIRRSNNTRLQMAIADMIHSDGLSFSFAGSKRFRTVLTLAKTVGQDFNVPSRNQISNDLLDLNFQSCWEANRDALLANASVFGLSFLGDGATIGRLPFINILGMCGGTPPVVIGIHDCTGHMVVGGKKDASYIADLFRNQMEELFSDPKHARMFGTLKENTDTFFFDGASNVQKAGEVLSVHYPRAVCLHGAEHVISLYFADISKLPPIKVSIPMNSFVYIFIRISLFYILTTFGCFTLCCQSPWF